MSTQLQQEERKLEEQKQKVKLARIANCKEKVMQYIKSGNDTQLGEACRQLAGYLNPPNVGRKHKNETTSSPISQ